MFGGGTPQQVVEEANRDGASGWAYLVLIIIIIFICMVGMAGVTIKENACEQEMGRNHPSCRWEGGVK
jgi:hypothetical protein